jgi:hypothetical protein
MPEQQKKCGNAQDVWLTSQIHDSWFSVDDIQWDASRRRLVIPLCNRKGCPASRFLIIEDVMSWDVRDTEQIGWYDIDSLQFDDEFGRVLLTGNIPISIAAVLGIKGDVYLAPAQHLSP